MQTQPSSEHLGSFSSCFRSSVVSAAAVAVTPTSNKVCGLSNDVTDTSKAALLPMTQLGIRHQLGGSCCDDRVHFQGTKNTENPEVSKLSHHFKAAWKMGAVKCSPRPSEGMTESQEAAKGDKTESKRALSATDEQFSKKDERRFSALITSLGVTKQLNISIAWDKYEVEYTIHFNCYWDTPPYQFSTLWVIGSMLPRFCDRAATSANVLDSFKETGVRVEVTVTSRAAVETQLRKSPLSLGTPTPVRLYCKWDGYPTKFCTFGIVDSMIPFFRCKGCRSYCHTRFWWKLAET
eukprot:Em0003g1085a